ncbi:MAG: SIMPL domain-containing protein [Deltaproteobacteria bacterium]|nr:SIMPL domain-containing protein [Deltaproteobacteria bacterium]
MSESRPDVIQVEVRLEEEVEASHAFLHVTVKGSSLVTGNAALTKAREVAALVQALEGVGVSQKEIRVENIYAEVSSGLLTKSSSATYTLRVRCNKLDTLADVLGAITSQKTVELESLEWGYPDDDALKTAWLVKCAERANERAKQLAEALGVKLLGVHRFGEPELSSHAQMYRGAPGAVGGSYDGSAPMRRKMGAADLGLAIAHAKKVDVRAVVEYRVSAFS